MDILLDALNAISPELGQRLVTLAKAREANIITLEQYQQKEQELKDEAQRLLVPPAPVPDLSPMLTPESFDSLLGDFDCIAVSLSETDFTVYKNGSQICRVNLPTTSINQLTSILQSNA